MKNKTARTLVFIYAFLMITLVSCYKQWYVSGEQVYFQNTPCHVVRYDKKNWYVLSPDADTNWHFYVNLKDIKK